MVCSLQRKVTSLSLALKEAKAVSTGNNRRMSTSAYFIYFKVHCEKLFCGAVSSSRGLARGLWAAEREMEGWTPRLRLWPDPSVLFLEKILKRWQSSKFWPESRASQVMQCGGNGSRCRDFSCGWGQPRKPQDLSLWLPFALCSQQTHSYTNGRPPALHHGTTRAHPSIWPSLLTKASLRKWNLSEP